MSKRARSSTVSGVWHSVSTIPYDRERPEKVIAGVYPGAQVPDHIRQFALGVTVDLGISEHTVEAATWILCWTERALQHSDFNVPSLYRVVYSLALGHCMITAQTRGYTEAGPHLCLYEKEKIMETAKEVFMAIEGYRVKHSAPTVAVPKKTPLVNDPFWLMFSSVCCSVAVGMDRVQMTSMEHTDKTLCFKRAETIDIQCVVYRISGTHLSGIQPSYLSRPKSSDPKSSDLKSSDLKSSASQPSGGLPKYTLFHPLKSDTAVQLAYLAEALAQQPEIVDQRVIDGEVRQIVTGTQYSIKCVRDLMDMWKAELTTLSTRRPSDKDACAQLFLDLEACKLKAVAPPKSKVMLYVTPWLYTHMWECSNPRVVWEAQRPSLSLKFKDMKYFDDVGDDDSARHEWFKVATSLSGFALFCPPIIKINGHNVKDPQRDSGKKWEFECIVYNRTHDKLYVMQLPLDVVHKGALQLLKGFWVSRGYAHIPESDVYSAALHGKRVFGEKTMEYSIPD